MNVDNEDYSEILNPEIVSMKDWVIPSPPGYNDSVTMPVVTTKTKSKQEEEHLNTLKSKKVWELAIAPAKSIPMNLIMSYFTGNSLQIIPVTMTIMLLWNPLKSIFNETNTIFVKLKTKSNNSEVMLAKVVFIICQLLNMGIGIYKLYNMGLIPHQETDWLDFKSAKEYAHVLSI